MDVINIEGRGDAETPAPASEPKPEVEDVIELEAWKRERQQRMIRLGAKLERMVREARQNPLGLYRLCFTDDRGEAIVIKWFHDEWTDLIMRNRCVMIEAPRGSTKTTFIVACILWFLGHNPELRFKLICGNDTNAAKRLAEIKSHIDQDPLYQLVFPDVKIDKKLKNDSLNLNLVRSRHSRDATVEARGVLSDGTGDRADVAVFDDCCNYKNSVHEPSTRPKVLQKIRGDWLNTLNPRDGRVWMIFTPWHVDDANSVLKKETRGKWAYKLYRHGKQGNPYHSIFPELFTEEWLRDKRQEIGSLEYARAYLCKALSGDVQVVRSEWLRPYTSQDLSKEMLNRCTAILSIDPTGGKGSTPNPKDPDYFGFTVALLDMQPTLLPFRPMQAKYRIYIVEALQVRLSTSQAAQLTIDLYSRWAPDVVLIEAQGAQSLHEWIYERAPHIPILPLPATLSKRARIESITPWLESPHEYVLFHPRTIDPQPQSFSIPIGGNEPVTAEALRDLRKQLVDFPTTHDDIADSLTQLLRYIRQWIIPLDAEHDGEEQEPTVNPRTPEVQISARFIGG